MRLRRQFTVRHMLLLTVVVAVGILAWQKFIYVHPAHKNQLYEKASIIRGGAIKVGSHQVKIDVVSRVDRDGTMLVEDGSGQSIQRRPKNAKVLERSAPWLDTAQIEFQLQGDSDLYEFRVFDHETREFVYSSNPFSGYRFDNVNTLQVHSVGQKLPDRLDVFVRMKNYENDSAPVIVPPSVGAEFSTAHGNVQINRIIQGMIGYTQGDGFIVSEEESSIGVLLGFDGVRWPNDEWYQVVIVTKRGERIHSDFGIRFPGSYVLEEGRAELIRSSLNLDSIQHFEFRPRGEYRRFVFEDVLLPKTSDAKFATPPSVVVSFADTSSEVSVPALEPLDFRLQLMDGNAVHGISSEGSVSSLSVTGNPANLGNQVTLIGRLRGVGKLDWQMTTNPVSPQASSMSTSGPAGHSFSYLYRTPISDFQSIKIQVSAPQP